MAAGEKHQGKIRCGRGCAGPPPQSRGGGASHDSLFADAETLDQISVTVRVLGLHVVQEPAALADQLQQTAARMMILRVRLEMVGQVVDAIAQNGDLNFRRPRVGVVSTVVPDDLRLAFLRQRHVHVLHVRPRSRREAMLPMCSAQAPSAPARRCPLLPILPTVTRTVTLYAKPERDPDAKGRRP